MRASSRGRVAPALIYAALIALAIWFLIPIYLIALAALSSQDGIYAYPKELLPTNLSTDTLTFFVNSAGVLDSLQRSLIVAAMTLALALVVGAPAGYAISRFVFRGANLFRLSIISTRAFPIVILAIPLTVTFINWGIDDTVFAVALVHGALTIPFVVLVTASVFTSVSTELEEAAMTLGCNRPQAFWKVVFPLARPGLAAAAIFTFFFSWNEVFAAAVLTLQNQTLPALMLSELEAAPLPYRVAGAFFLLIPCFVVIFFSRKYLTSTLARVAG